MTTFGCDEFRETAPDLALGLLAGDDRGAALNHLATCADCRRHLTSLVQVADDLLLLAPSAEPEIGFESRVMARLAAEGAFSRTATATGSQQSAAPPFPGTPAPLADDAGPTLLAFPPVAMSVRPSRDRHRWARSLAMSVAAGVVVVAGVTGLAAGLARGHETGRASGLLQQAQAANQLAARTVVVRADGGRSTCQLVAFQGDKTQPARLVIQLHEPGEPPDDYQVQAEPTKGGPAVVIGTISMDHGYGILTASIPDGTGPVDAVLILEGPSIKYRATFASV
jgi:hypothetical protein